MKKWINTLKVGDKVVVCARNHLYTTYRESSISEITSLGTIKVVGYCLPFDHEGKALSDSSCYLAYLCNPEDEDTKRNVQLTKEMGR